ncbi:hypothetical protein SLS63_009854 [Diaporthe eres]|uniref:Uncharacterized protein n=1 Tax=Diaporthe eres TaxID=83184 RepID=A0ABR1NYG7_DIAER
MPQVDTTAVSVDAAEVGTRQSSRKRGRPRKTPENGGALTPKELRLACAYNAFETLGNPRVSLDSIRNKFRFLLSLMSREHLTSYYKASLQARLNQSPLDTWDAVPFYGLGGAGSHYPDPSPPPRRSGDPEDPAHPDWPFVSDPLFELTTGIRENLDDTWFDARDLEGYLKERGVCLVAQRPSSLQHEASSTYIDVVRLSQGVWYLFAL